MRRAATALLAGYLCIASILLQAGPRSLLDRHTGATIVICAAPWVLALEQPHLAAHSRDYVALYAVEINISGNRRHRLAVFFWSTVPGRSGYAGPQPRIALRVDDRLLRLTPLPGSAQDNGISKWPLHSPGRGAQLAIYDVDDALLRQIALARVVTLRPEADQTPAEDVWFETWRDARRAFADFVRSTLDG